MSGRMEVFRYGQYSRQHKLNIRQIKFTSTSVRDVENKLKPVTFAATMGSSSVRPFLHISGRVTSGYLPVILNVHCGAEFISGALCSMPMSTDRVRLYV